MNIKKILDPEYLKKDINSVTLEVTRKCNFQCSYCDIHGTESLIDYKIVVNFLNDFGEDKNLSITLFGGEPTEHPQIKNIIQNLKNDITLFTNFSQSIEFYEKLINIQKNLNFNITYHPDKISFKLFLKKLKNLKFITNKIKVMFMFDSFKDNELNNYEKIKDLKIPIDIQGIVYNRSRLNKDIPIIKEHMGNLKIYFNDGSDISTNSEYVLSNHLNNFKYYKCDCGLRNLYISQEGYIYPCLDYRKKNYFPKHIKDFSKIALNKTICILDECNSELEVPKERILP